MADKVTIMVIKVDLQCSRCYKKIKKILCKFPQIRDQIYDVKNNTVTITVVCCSPEKIKQKILCKGGDSIKGIEIKEPPKPKPPPPAEKPKEPEKPKQPQKPKEPEKPKPPPEKPKEPEKPKPPPEKPKEPEKPNPPKPKEPEKPKPPPEKPKEPEKPKPPPEKPKEQIPIAYPPLQPGHPFGLCCRECYEGHSGGPCFHGHGGPPLPYFEGYGRPVYDSWGGGCNRGYYPSRCDYFCEESPSACTIM